MKKLDLSIKGTDDYNTLVFGQKLPFVAGLKGENILILGGGGVGKSFIINLFCRHIPGIVICASTGIAGVQISGVTLDSFMGFGGLPMTPDDAQTMRPDIRKRLENTHVILLDEASMTRIDRFECMETRLRAAKKNNKPFGGVQIILVGDFCQLTPIVKSRGDEADIFRSMYGQKRFLFESEAYQNGGFTPYVLTDYIRNRCDAQRRLLRNLRMGHKIDDVVREVNRLASSTASEHSIYLCSTNARADTINARRYAEIAGVEKVFYGIKKGKFSDILVPERLALKLGCRVMVCANNKDENYSNGDLGIVCRITSQSVFVNLDRGPTVEVKEFTWTEYMHKVVDNSMDSSEVGSYSQMPLKLAYAITIHKSQGMTLDDVVLDLSDGLFSEAHAYVALSRVRDLTRLHLTRPLRRSDVKINARAIKFTKEMSTLALKQQPAEALRLGVDMAS